MKNEQEQKLKKKSAWQVCMIAYTIKVHMSKKHGQASFNPSMPNKNAEQVQLYQCNVNFILKAQLLQ